MQRLGLKKYKFHILNIMKVFLQDQKLKHQVSVKYVHFKIHQTSIEAF